MYSGRTDDGAEFSFGTSGLLFRSNKLMYDRQTFTLWENLTGEPVVGKMATSGLRLKILPMTLTTWNEWYRLYPQTSVLFLDDSYGKKWNYIYKPGLADRARSGVQFPVWQKSKLLNDKEEVYAIRVEGIPKAYSLKTLADKKIINDQIGKTPVVISVSTDSGAVRIYERGNHTFSKTWIDENGHSWKADEQFLVFQDQKLPRIPGHVVFWFAWYGFFPQTELYR